MFKKKSLFLLALGYIGGIAIALKFHKKTATSLKEELSKTDKKCEVFWKHIIQIHRDLFFEAKEVIVSPENMKKLEKYKEKLLAHVDEFKDDATEKIEELKKKGLMKKEEIEQEIQKLYDRRIELVEQVKEKSSDLIDNALAQGKGYLEEAKERLQEAFEELKNSLKKQK